MNFNQTTLVESLNGFVPAINPFLYWTDSYKVSHKRFETNGVKEIYSNFTARFDKYLKELLGDAYDGHYVTFGVQYMMLRLHFMSKVGFFDRPKEEVIGEMKRVHGAYIGNEDFEHFEALHDLGYLPVEMKALAEGTIAPVGTPFFTIRNTLPEFEWLPNFLESGISTEVWKPLTVATVARVVRQITNNYALATTGSIEGTEWQNHDFHVRGASGFESAAICGTAFLTSSCGTDNLPALWSTKLYYGVDVTDGLLAGSVPAGEHSVTTSGILAEAKKMELNGEEVDMIEAERRYARQVMSEKFTKNIVSYVADSFNYWAFVTQILPSLKAEVMARDGKFVVRGDSGNPVNIIAGYIIDTVHESDMEDYGNDWGDYWNALQAYLYDGVSEVINFGGVYYKLNFAGDELDGYEVISEAEAHGTIEALWRTFGGTENSLGYKVLDSHIGMIYGDGITPQRQDDILSRLKAKGFASTNVVFGVGSYTLNMLSRDHLGMAIKATNQIIEIEGEVYDQPIYKDPKTDTSKKSKRGLLSVFRDELGKIITEEMQTRVAESLGLLETIYKDGEIKKVYDLFEIRDRIWK